MYCLDRAPYGDIGGFGTQQKDLEEDRANEEGSHRIEKDHRLGCGWRGEAGGVRIEHGGWGDDIAEVTE